MGVVLTIFESRGARFGWLPSAARIGFGLILPGTLTVPVAIGGALGWIWYRLAPGSFDRYRFSLAAGLIAGDALVSGILVPVLALLGVLSL